MRYLRTGFTPRAALVFTAREIRQLWEAASRHYDVHCRMLIKPRSGSDAGGLLTTLCNYFPGGNPVENSGISDSTEMECSCDLTFRDVDTLCKTAEQIPMNSKPNDGMSVNVALHGILRRINENYSRVAELDEALFELAKNGTVIARRLTESDIWEAVNEYLASVNAGYVGLSRSVAMEKENLAVTRITKEVVVHRQPLKG